MSTRDGQQPTTDQPARGGNPQPILTKTITVSYTKQDICDIVECMTSSACEIASSVASLLLRQEAADSLRDVLRGARPPSQDAD
ncbi:MAG TPA: hypothetical protein VMS77_09445 [Conexivisphaerales archaeon]|nr:hypothetical protein [Conexivisphaerales archaeon]